MKPTGNVLFLILLAVALFAALSYAVTQSNRSGGNNASGESYKLAASAVIQYANMISTAIQRLRLINGCKDTNLDFGNTVFVSVANANLHSPNHNSLAPSDDRCDVFSAESGLNAQQLSETTRIQNQSYGGYATGSGAAVVAAIEGIGTSANDLVWMFPHLKKEVCLEVNNYLGITNPSGNLPTESVSAAVKYDDGDFSSGVVIGDTATQVSGQHSFCLKHSAAPDNDGYFFHVLIPR